MKLIDALKSWGVTDKKGNTTFTQSSLEMILEKVNSLPTEQETKLLINSIHAADPTKQDAVIKDLRLQIIEYTDKVKNV